MNICVSNNSRHKEEAQEIRLSYLQNSSWIKEHPDKRYIVVVNSDTITDSVVKTIDFISETVADYSVECKDMKVMLELINRGYKAFLTYPVIDWETFQDLREAGVSDIYIDSPLTFCMQEIKKAKQGTDLRIRVSPTLSTSSGIMGMRANSFFLRPEDMDSYSTMIDVLDFHEINQEREDALFSVYNRGSWPLNIEELIPGLPHANNMFINDEFARHRFNCGQICKVPGHSCHICETQLKIAAKFMEVRARLQEVDGQ